MTKLSANLGLLWQELDLLEAIQAAHRSGFDAVEAYWPYITRPVDVALVLEEVGIPLLSFDTVAGDLAGGDFGLAALPGRQDDARSAIDKALAYALDVSARSIHVLAGRIEAGSQSTSVYLENLRYAAGRGAEFGIGVLIEPLSPRLHEGYYLQNMDQASEIIERVGSPNLGVVFDCFQIADGGGNVLGLLDQYLEVIAHVQIASVPDRSEPAIDGDGPLDVLDIERLLTNRGYRGYVGAEYKPTGRTEETLRWMTAFRP